MKRILAGAAILATAALAAAFFSLNALVKRLVETGGPRLTKTAVRLDRAALLPIKGTGTLHGFAVANPPGYTQQDALRVGRVKVTVEPRSLLSAVIVIPAVEVVSPEISFEGTPSSNNLTELQKNVESFAPAPAKRAPRPAPAKKLIIDDFRLTGATVRVLMKPLPAAVIRLPDLHLTGIGRKQNGASAQEAAAQVLSALTASVTREAVGSLKGLESAAKTLSGLGKKLGNLFKR